MNQSRPRGGLTIVALLMIVFGLAELTTSFTHRFFGLSTAQVAASTYLGATIGTLYVVAGLLIPSGQLFGNYPETFQRPATSDPFRRIHIYERRIKQD